MKKTVISFYILTMSFLLLSCSLIDRETNNEASQSPLQGTRWTLQAFEPKESEAIDVTNTMQESYLISFVSDTVFRAISGCNTCDGLYENDTSGNIEMVIGCTRAHCGWSSHYEQAIIEAYRYEVIEEKLYLFHKGSSGVTLQEGKLRFTKGVNEEYPWNDWLDG